MRISTSQMYYSGTSNIVNGQSELYKIQNQLSTGRKILTPRDNPVDSTLALMTTQSKEVNSTFLKNQGTASDRLAYIESQLGSVSDLLQEAIGRGIQGGNGTYSAQQKQAIAEDLRRRFDGLVDLANTRDATGEYVFSGNRTNTQPFVVNGAGGNYQLPSALNPAAVSSVEYLGDEGRRQIQVEVSQTVATTESGQDVFVKVLDSKGNVVGRSVFDALQNMIDWLDPATGVTPPSYEQSLSDLNSALDHISRIRASLGARMNQMDSLSTVAGDLAVQFETRLAKLEGLDYAEAISNLNQQQMQLEASQASFVKTSQLSLFDLIS